jgi:energy-coupling factor transporter transmembrane protein EcfT
VKSEATKMQQESSLIERIDKVVPVKLILSFVFLVIYIAGYQTAGFILASTFFLMAESFILVEKEKRKKWRVFIIVFSIVASLFIYFVFTNYLSLFLPKGILG